MPTKVAVLVAVAVLAGVTLQGDAQSSAAAVASRFKAIAFDYLVLFNPDSVVVDVEREFPGRGRELTNVWRTRQFEYSWLRSITNRYADFFDITEDALVYATEALKLDLTPDKKRRLLDAYLHLAPWPDTGDALRKLSVAGVRVIALANFSPTMLRSNADHAGLTNLFERLISTDAYHTYKPDPRAYQLGVDRLRLSKREIVFAAFGGWDAAGAKSFGYPTFWVNRFGQPAEQLGIRADGTSTDLAGLLDFVLKERSPRHEERVP